MIKKTFINFNWKYDSSFNKDYLSPIFDDSDFKTIQIPHSNIETPYNNFNEKIYQFESYYRKKIWIDEINSDERIYVIFNGVMTNAKIYLNRIYAGEHKGGYTPFKIDLTDLIKVNADNILVVYVDSNERKEIPPFDVDYLTYGEIYREVSLEINNNIHIENVAIKTKNVLTDQPLLDINISINNHNKEIKDVNFQFELFFNKYIVKKFIKKKNLSSALFEIINFKEVLENISLWNNQNPNLYHLHISLLDGEKVIDRHIIRFGFREIQFKDSGFYLNNKKVKIQGLNRHQSFPYVGYAMPKSAQYKDADILKDINHPCVIIWEVRINKSQDSNHFYQKTNELAKQFDSSRPTGGVRCIKKSNLLEDIYTYNDFSHTGKNPGVDKKRNVTSTGKAYLITEYNSEIN